MTQLVNARRKVSYFTYAYCYVMINFFKIKKYPSYYFEQDPTTINKNELAKETSKRWKRIKKIQTI
jgi:hypothetical protein